ncbi:MAG TPA: methylmalonyl-CoA mutase family protein [Acidimicrobiales bacterium]|nr:methylmalonyl-CoA mutase family protein [Acidimicrobiales bacterium]
MSETGITRPVVAGPEHVRPGLADRLGQPGQPPYTRGIHAEMYRTRHWTVRQLAGFGTAADTNGRYRFLLERGATGINGVFDYPSLRAFDSDDPRAEPDVGRGGVAVDGVADFVDLFDGIDLGAVSVSLVSSQPIGAVPHLAMFLVAAQRAGTAATALRGTTQNDFLMETCITIGPAALPPAASFRMACDVAQFCIEGLPRWNPVSVAGYNYREAGADAVLEVALSLAHARAVVAELARRGVDATEAIARMSFFFAAHIDVFEEVAKFRAARRVWHRLAMEELGCRDPRAARLRFHAQTAGTTFSAATPLANVARGALEGLSAIAGGAQSLHVNGFDEAYAIPTEASAAVALRTQQVLLDESGVAASADPFGGSYLVEHLTDELEARVEEGLRSFELQGGVVAITESGWLHAELGRRAWDQYLAAEARPSPDLETGPATQEPEMFVLPDGVLERQRARLAEIRRGRDGRHVRSCLHTVASHAAAGRCVVPATLGAVAAGATLGEVGSALREALGTWNIPLG